MKTFAVLGLGNSLKYFLNNPCDFITVGVNDIYKYYPADYVVCVDKPERFATERRKIIEMGNQKKFFTHLQEWRKITNYCHQEIPGGRGDLTHIEKKNVLMQSNNSAYAATAKAYQLGAKKIILYGVDFTNHHALNGKLAETAIKHFVALKNKLKEKNVSLFVGSTETALFPHIPVVPS